MIPKHQLSGIIVAGGNSKRMGQDKGFLLYQDKPFITHVAKALEPLVSQVLVISPDESYSKLGYTTYPDLIPNIGPLGGLYTGLYYSKTPWNICLSVDVPKLTTQLLKELVIQAEATQGAVQVATENQTHPLVAVYPKTMQAALKTAIEKGHFKLQRLVNQLEHSNLHISKQQATQVLNINTKDDLKQLED